jgi:hypothetical protein
MSLYVTLDHVRRRGVLIPDDVDFQETRYPGIVLERATEVSAFVDAQLIKRYAAPFQTPYPDVVIRWVAILTSYEILVDLRGGNPESPQLVTARERYDRAVAQIAQAADSEKGMFELPLRQTDPLGASAVNAGGPLGYSESSPYHWMDRQRERISSEGR